MRNGTQQRLFNSVFFRIALTMLISSSGSAGFTQDVSAPPKGVDPFSEKCRSVIDVPITQRDSLPTIDEYGKVRRRLVDQAAAEAIEQVVGMAIASDREVKMALHNEVTDSQYSEKMSGGSEGLVRTKVVKEEVLSQAEGRFLSMAFIFSVCIPKKPTKPAVRITATPEAFFDPLSGDPKVWYWQSRTGEFEFYDNAGFHPGTGELLKPVSREVINVWRLEEAKRKAAAEDRARQQTEMQEQGRKQAQLADRCDELAANPYDKQLPRGVVGVEFLILKLNATDAITACRGAVAKTPGEGRFYYQLGRALQARKGGTKEALQLFTKAIELGHVAAYDNLGHLMSGQKAQSMFESGAASGDPSSMFSLAWLLEPQGLEASAYVVKAQRSLLLYKKAGQLGHVEAKQKFEELSQFILMAKEAEARKLQQDRQSQKVVIDALGGILGRIGR